MVEFKPEQGIDSMTVFAQQDRCPGSQETVGGISFNIITKALDIISRVPLMYILAGGTRNVSGAYRPPGQFIEKREIPRFSFNIPADVVNQLVIRMG